MHSPGLHAQLLNGDQHTPLTTNTTLSSAPVPADAASRATAVVVVDENDRRLLIRQGTIRTPIAAQAEKTRRVQTIVREDIVEDEREGRMGILGDFWRAFIS